MKSISELFMIPRKLYENILDEVCADYGISQPELLILIFLDDHPELDTAKDMLMYLPFTKSYISMSLRHLEEKGYVRGEYRDGNRRTIHISACESASSIIREGKAARESFIDSIMFGFDPEEKRQFVKYMERIFLNIRILSGEKSKAGMMSCQGVALRLAK